MELLAGAAKTQQLQKTIQTNLNKALRIISFDKYTPRSKPLFNQLGILDFKEAFNLECAKLIFDLKTVVNALYLKIQLLDMAIKLVNPRKNNLPFL